MFIDKITEVFGWYASGFNLKQKMCTHGWMKLPLGREPALKARSTHQFNVDIIMSVGGLGPGMRIFI